MLLLYMQQTVHIIESIQNNSQMLKRDFVLDHLYLYGSFSRNLQNELSDLDLAYELIPGHKMTLKRLNKLESVLQEITQIGKIELVGKNNLNPIVQSHAESDIFQLF